MQEQYYDKKRVYYWHPHGRCRLAHSEDHQHQLLQTSSLGEEHPLVIR